VSGAAMTFFHNLVHRPRQLWLRKAIFQIHLWTGIALSLYVVVIALSGSVLVFENELTGLTLPRGLTAWDPSRTVSIPEVMRRFAQTCPGCKASLLISPYPAVPAFQIRAVDAHHRRVSFIADPVSGAILAQPRTWVDWMHDLHLYLLLGSRHGEQVNGVGAAILLLLCVTGLFLWWPGIRNWSRGFRISLRSHWRRINFDVHYAIGIWTLAIVAWWSISGVYFAWYQPLEAAINSVFPVRAMLSPPMPPLALHSGAPASLAAIVAAAQHASPHGRLFGLYNPSLTDPTVLAEMDLRDPGNFAHRDLITIETSSARVLTVWRYGNNVTLGDWILWSMFTLHFGTVWGLPIKILWFLLGLSLAVLSITGLIMYWNRYLRHHFGHRSRP
jgi:uncharacterized iron-regulated membrane protein